MGTNNQYRCMITYCDCKLIAAVSCHVTVITVLHDIQTV